MMYRIVMYRIWMPLFFLPLFPAIGVAQKSADTSMTISFRKRFAIGGTNGDFTPPSLFAKDIAADRAGNLYVLDRASNSVYRYDARGARVATFGRNGRGPGEIVRATAIGTTAEGGVVVADNGKRALVFFGPQAQVLPEQPTRGMGTVQQLLSAGAQRVLLQATVGDTDVVIGASGEARQRIVVAPPAPRRPVRTYERCGLVEQTSAPLLSPILVSGGNAEMVAVASDTAYAITLYPHSGGRRVLSSGRSAVRLDAAMAIRVLGDSQTIYVGTRPCSVSTSDLMREATLARFLRPYARLILHPDGTVWALRTGPIGGERIADVYSLQTGYRGWVRIGRSNPVAFMSDGGMISLEYDDLDAPTVVVYDTVMPLRSRVKQQ
ncbi:hypothetical protein [Gemmatimonas aurantiaca]|uniref:hypothetical protein n=1 Tax=Gemmatimonas aurantiaca TaxID=173480 RepID=UPI00301DA57C